jgi:DNA-directed RNA polymerase specialized sigma24 family protein
VRLLLGDYHALKLRRYNGDTSASDILIDMATAINRAGLTDRQRQALRLVYFDDLTQVDAGITMQCSKQTVNRLVDIATVKIARVYEFWARHGEGYALNSEGER